MMRTFFCIGLVATTMFVSLAWTAELPVATGWRVHLENMTGKGPDGWVGIADWKPLSFFKTYRPEIQHTVDSLALFWIADDQEAVMRVVTAIDGVVFIELRRHDILAPDSGVDVFVLLAGPSSEQLRPVHVLITDETLIASVESPKVIDVGGRPAVSFKYSVTGMGAHQLWYVYMLHEGQPTDIGIRHALVYGRMPLPEPLNMQWERWRPQSGTQKPPGGWRESIDLATLRGSLYLIAKSTGEGRWFDVWYGFNSGLLHITRAEPAVAP